MAAPRAPLPEPMLSNAPYSGSRDLKDATEGSLALLAPGAEVLRLGNRASMRRVAMGVRWNARSSVREQEIPERERGREGEKVRGRGDEVAIVKLSNSISNADYSSLVHAFMAKLTTEKRNHLPTWTGHRENAPLAHSYCNSIAINALLCSTKTILLLY